MSKVRITFEYNNKTGKRDLHIDYESDPSALPHEHQEEHRDIVNRIIDLQSMEEDQDVEVDREEPKTEVESARQEEKQLRQAREKIKSAER
ncbi:MAG: hypothetical protein GY866_08195 [Proteobacteria bacterium]|nr:hypothetical protein [Pseudomonadota bacterium]